MPPLDLPCHSGMSRHSVFCITTSPIHASRTVDRLKTAKLPNHSISALLADPGMYWPFAKNTDHHVLETAIAGATTGVVIGVAWGWIAGIAALSIPGVGPFLACGPIVSAMSGGSIGAALGGVGGGLIRMGIPETEARIYEKRILKGEILLSVHTECRGELHRAKGIFDDSRAGDIWASDPPKPWPI